MPPTIRESLESQPLRGLVLSMNYWGGVVLLTLAVTASPITDLATILFCGTAEEPTPICCQAAREARKQTDKQGRAIIDRYVAKNCDKEKSRSR
jgi:hypothetical protein